jgi:hypothetical protein
MDGERLAQLLRLRIGIKPQGVHRCGSHRFQRERRKAERLSLVLSFTRLAMRGCSPGT